ncbi:cytochrome c maturation protein CcmE [Altererythrobacter lauratis]|uniref:Cytochrome c-type biogenesis protein CcmE n=1 Tax=Alteraurantiacibacter lauratis TaxID=2054627 RepID=A0ABV7EEX9_9SPHN
MSLSVKPKHQRLVLLVIALVALVGAGLLAAWALRSQASYFYLPSEIVAKAPDPDRGVRLGGMVETGSIQTAADGVTITFVVSDGTARVPVTFAGIAPALFVEGSGVVAEGRMGADGVFVADNLLAKHDENYMPRELEGMSTDDVRAQIEATLQ